MVLKENVVIQDKKSQNSSSESPNECEKSSSNDTKGPLSEDNMDTSPSDLHAAHDEPPPPRPLSQSDCL